MRSSILLTLLVIALPGCGAPQAPQQPSAAVVPTIKAAEPSSTAQATPAAEPPVLAQTSGAEPGELEADDPDTFNQPPRYAWYRTYTSGGPWDVITELTIPGVFTDKRSGMSIRRYRRVYRYGIRSSPPYLSLIHESADGLTGSGYNGGINLRDTDSEDSIFLDVSYSWTTGEEVRGSMKGGARVQIGIPAEFDLDDGCRLKVTWQRNESMPDEPREPNE